MVSEYFYDEYLVFLRNFWTGKNVYREWDKFTFTPTYFDNLLSVNLKYFFLFFGNRGSLYRNGSASLK